MLAFAPQSRAVVARSSRHVLSASSRDAYTYPAQLLRQTGGYKPSCERTFASTTSGRLSEPSNKPSSGAISRLVPISPVSQTKFPPPSFPPSFGSNQLVPVSDETNRRLHGLLACFDTPVRFAFAYGSGVFSQTEAGPEHAKRPSTKDGKKMIDFIMAVTHPQHWHSLNMAQHPRHYSLLSRLLGGIGIGLVQQRGAKIWYNPYVKLEDELVKYGIISVDDLCTDLLDWETLYVSGRMHKPVALVTSDARVRLAQQVNLASALRTALLLLPREFSEVELYTRIASLSYMGDFRMSVPGGENSNKVRNIVINQREEFRRLYAGLMRNLGTLSVEEARGNRFRIVQDDSVATRASYAARLPRCLRQKVQDYYSKQPQLDPAFLKLSLSKTLDTVPRSPSRLEREETLEAFWSAVVQRQDFADVLLQQIAATVKGPAWSQSIKGIYTAGFTRTLRYVAAKIGKAQDARQRVASDNTRFTIPAPRHLKRLSLCSPTLPSSPKVLDADTNDLFSPAINAETVSASDTSSSSLDRPSEPGDDSLGLALASSHDFRLSRAKKAVHHMRTYSSHSAASFASHASTSRQPSAEIVEVDESSLSSPASQRKQSVNATMPRPDLVESPSHSRFGSRSDAGSIFNADHDMSVSMLSVVDPAGMDEIENSVRQSKTIEDFTNIISEFRMNRQTLYSDSLAGSLAHDADTIPASASHHSLGQRSEAPETVRCTCCCSKEDCPRALRARQEWRDLEADLRLSAEIGQALLRRHDAMQAKLQKQAEEYMQQRDGLMTRLTKSYKETSALERELAQSNLNLEAGDSSNRALLHELEDARSQLTKLKASQTRLSGADQRAQSLQRELDDLKQELAAERKRAQAAEARSRKLELKSTQLKEALNTARKEASVDTTASSRALFDDNAIQAARDRLTHGLRHERSSSLATNRSTFSDDAEQAQAVDALVRDNEALRTDNDKLRSLVDTCNEELDTLRNSVTNAITIVASPAPDLARFDEQPSSYLEAKDHETTTSSVQPGIPIVTGSAHIEGRSTTSRPQMSSHASSSGSFTFPPTSPIAPTASDCEGATFSRSESLAYTADSSAASQPPDSISFPPSSRSSATSRDTEKQTADFLQSDPARRESRTAQLSNLLEYVNRLFNRLSAADVDTLTRRLQRQNLAGDAGHLAKTTVHSILRDVDGLRDHFRKLIESEARNHARDDNSAHSKDFAGESLVARKEFFALLKAFRDILCELAKLRLCINDIHLNPGQAGKLLHEHLGANTAEDRSLIPIPSAVNWLGKMLLGGPSGTPTTPSSGASSPATSLTVPDAAGNTATKAGRPVTGRNTSGNFASHLAPRASPAVVSSTLAVEVKGTHASAAESSKQRLSVSPQTPVGAGLRAGPRPQRGRSQASLTRVQSRNLSGLFAGSLAPSYAGLDAARAGHSDLSSSLAQTSSFRPRLDASKTSKPWQRPLSRIVDDDEISIHRGRAIRQQVFDDSDDEGSDDDMKGSGNLLERTLRPRGLSDSSIRSTFIDMADGAGGIPVSPAANRIRPSPISRIITPATLSLHSTPSAPTVASASNADQDKRSADGNASPSVSSDRSGSLTPGAVSVAGGVASSIFSRSEKVLSFLSGGVVGSGAPIQPSSTSTNHSGPILRQTPSIAALNKAAARGAASHDLSVSPRNASAIQTSSAETRAQAGLGLGLPQRPALGGTGSSRSGF